MMSEQLCGDGAGAGVSILRASTWIEGTNPCREFVVFKEYTRRVDDAQRLGELGRNSDPRG